MFDSGKIFVLYVVSQGAREIFKLLPHSFVEPSKLPDLFESVNSLNIPSNVYLSYVNIIAVSASIGNFLHIFIIHLTFYFNFMQLLTK